MNDLDERILLINKICYYLQKSGERDDDCFLKKVNVPYGWILICLTYSCSKDGEELVPNLFYSKEPKMAAKSLYLADMTLLQAILYQVTRG